MFAKVLHEFMDGEASDQRMKMVVETLVKSLVTVEAIVATVEASRRH